MSNIQADFEKQMSNLKEDKSSENDTDNDIDNNNESNKDNKDNDKDNNGSDEDENLCPICYDEISIPHKLSCGHTFCHLCIKASCEMRDTCPYCRTKVDPTEFYLNIGVDKNELKMTGAAWSYSGKNGFWLYDKRSNAEIEEMYQKYLVNRNPENEKVVLMIKNDNFEVNFRTMQQKSKHGTRKIRRDDDVETANIIVGMSGVKF